MRAKRLPYIDALAGIMIAWMILGHCGHFSQFKIPFHRFLSFYMPWFFYKSGAFFIIKDRSELLKKDIGKYLRVFIVYSLLGWFVWSACGLMDGTLSIRGIFVLPVLTFVKYGCVSGGNGALWFLLTLFFVRQVSNVVLRKMPPPLLAIICFSIAFALNIIGWYNYSWWFGNIFSGMFFFIMGYWLKDKEDNPKLFLASIVFFGCVILANLFGWIMDFPYLYMHANKMYRGDYMLFYPMALAGIIMCNHGMRILYKYKDLCVLEYIGRNSMYLYVTHWILFTMVSFVSKFFFHVDLPLILFVILLCSSVLFLPIIIKLIEIVKNKYVFIGNII